MKKLYRIVCQGLLLRITLHFNKIFTDCQIVCMFVLNGKLLSVNPDDSK